MDKNLQYLIDQAKKHTITPEEHEAQVRSFAYGNTRIENGAITKAHIEHAMTSLQSEREPVRS